MAHPDVIGAETSACSDPPTTMSSPSISRVSTPPQEIASSSDASPFTTDPESAQSQTTSPIRAAEPKERGKDDKTKKNKDGNADTDSEPDTLDGNEDEQEMARRRGPFKASGFKTLTRAHGHNIRFQMLGSYAYDGGSSEDPKAFHREYRFGESGERTMSHMKGVSADQVAAALKVNDADDRREYGVKRLLIRLV